MSDPSTARWDGLVVGATLVTLDSDVGYGLVADGALGWRDGRLTYVGSEAGLPGAPQALAREVIEAAGDCITPGLVDCHTHVVFAGDRASEFEQRLQGASYEDIARAGGGILSTVRHTRNAGEDALLTQSLARAAALRADGVTTLEVKSGYGLDLDNERKMLRVARRLGEQLGITVRTSFLGAHALPPEFSDRDAYIDAVVEWLPRLHGEELVDAVDAFCERIGFSHAQTRRVFEAARTLGLPVKLHADQLSDGDGAALVAEFGGMSADHVEYTSTAGVRAMAEAGAVAVLLPGAFHVLRETRVPPIDDFRVHGVPMAVATDCNPGTSPLLSLRQAMQLACTHFRLTPEEALRGATAHGARALGFDDRGVLRTGLRADFVHWRVREPAELCYWLGGALARGVFVGGTRVA
jgi:imidazolonepropionase